MVEGINIEIRGTERIEGEVIAYAEPAPDNSERVLIFEHGKKEYRITEYDLSGREIASLTANHVITMTLDDRTINSDREFLIKQLKVEKEKRGIK